MKTITKPIRRMTNVTVRDRGRYKRLVIVLYPSGTIGLRLERTRREETINIDSVYDRAVKQRVAAEQAAKKAKRKKVTR